MKYNHCMFWCPQIRKCCTGLSCTHNPLDGDYCPSYKVGDNFYFTQEELDKILEEIKSNYVKLDKTSYKLGE